MATGGYVAGAAAGEWGDDLFDAYVQALDGASSPIGMSNLTLSFDEVVARDSYAQPFGLNDGEFPIPLEMEMLLLPRRAAPAGPHRKTWLNTCSPNWRMALRQR
ncbi:MAG: hypothetical protein R2856_07260 [Caldilineaceae bacterium]